MTDCDSTQSTWERPCGGRNYTQRNFFRWLDKLEKDMHTTLVDDKDFSRILDGIKGGKYRYHDSLSTCNFGQVIDKEDPLYERKKGTYYGTLHRFVGDNGLRICVGRRVFLAAKDFFVGYGTIDTYLNNRSHISKEDFNHIEKMIETRDALGADRTLTPGGEGSIPLPAANDKEGT